MSIKVQFLPVGLYILLYVILFYSQPSKAPAGRSNTYIPTMDYFYKTLLFVTLTVAVRAQTCSTDGSSAKVSTSSITLGNETFQLEKAVEIYPNPCSDVLHIQMPSDQVLSKVTVFNNLGQKVLEAKSLDIVTTSLSSGVHFIEITTAEGTIHKKFIKL